MKYTTKSLIIQMADEAREALLERLPPAKDALTPGGISVWGMGVLLPQESPSVTVTEDEQSYTAILQGTFTLRVQKDDPFRQRFLILFLGLL